MGHLFRFRKLASACPVADFAGFALRCKLIVPFDVGALHDAG